MMLKCTEATRLLSEAEDRRLAPGERIRLRLHVLACSACRNFGRQLPFLRDAMRAYRMRPDDPDRDQQLRTAADRSGQRGGGQRGSGQRA